VLFGRRANAHVPVYASFFARVSRKSLRSQMELIDFPPTIIDRYKMPNLIHTRTRIFLFKVYHGDIILLLDYAHNNYWTVESEFQIEYNRSTTIYYGISFRFQ